MGALDIRTEIHEMVNGLDDQFLKVVHSMLNTYVEQKKDSVMGYRSNGDSIIAKESVEVYNQRVEAIDSGEFTSLEDLKKASEKW